MSTITNNAISSNAKQVRYGAVWSSIYDMLKPQIWQNIVKLYGKGVGLAEMTSLNGGVVSVAGPTKTVYEEGSPYKLVELGAAITSVGESVHAHATLAAGEYDISDKCYLAVNDALVIPAYYLEEDGSKSVKPEIYQVTAIVGAGAAAVYTLVPQKDNIAIVEDIPNGTKLAVISGLYANEAAVGKPKASGWYSRSFTCSTVRTPWGQGGSQQSNQRYQDELSGGYSGIFSKNTIEADLRHSKGISDNMWIGGGVTNGALVMANRDGDNIDVTGTVGVLQHLVDRAMPQYYTAAYDKPCFEDIKAALQSQGVMERNVTFCFGSELGRQIENLNLDFIKEFSGGTDFMKTMGSIDSTFKAVKYNGVFVSFKELSSLSDPISYGADAFDDSFRSMGFIVPDVDVNVRGSLESLESIKLKNLTLGYKNYNGENRTRLVSTTNGLGPNATDLYDDSRGDILSEFMVIMNATNQCILVQDDRILVEP
jgi:hypothetical protein